MIYLQNFIFPSVHSEENFLADYYGPFHPGNSYHTNIYPFKVLSAIGLFRLDFEPITILYGGLLSTPHAKIYNLDGAPACVSQFEELEAMQVYYALFASMKDKFEKFF